jgi:hypothetical protein
MMILLTKGIEDLSFWGAFLFYCVKYVIYAAVAVGAIFCGIRLRKRKDAKIEAQRKDQES